MKVMIGIPCMEEVKTDFMQSMLGLQRGEVAFAITKSSLVYDARNKIAEMALNHNYDVIVWFDSDMIFESDTLLKFLKRYEEGYDYVSGLCFARRYPTTPCVYSHIGYKANDEGITQVELGGFDEYPDEMFEIKASGFAAVMTSTKMIRDIAIKHGPPFYPRYGFGEDLTFCYMAGQEGYKMYCDPSIKLGHVGSIVFNEESFKSQKEKTHEV